MYSDGLWKRYVQVRVRWLGSSLAVCATCVFPFSSLPCEERDRERITHVSVDSKDITNYHHHHHP